MVFGVLINEATGNGARGRRVAVPGEAQYQT